MNRVHPFPCVKVKPAKRIARFVVLPHQKANLLRRMMTVGRRAKVLKWPFKSRKRGDERS